MDPRIQAILAKYENEENEEAEKHVDKPTTPEPPKTLEQWLERRPAGSERWPDDVDSGKKSEISVASVGLGSLEEIMEDLGRHACILFGWCVPKNCGAASSGVLQDIIKFYQLS